MNDSNPTTITEPAVEPDQPITEPEQPRIDGTPPDPPRALQVPTVARSGVITDWEGHQLMMTITDDGLIIRTKGGQAWTADAQLIGLLMSELDAAAARLP